MTGLKAFLSDPERLMSRLNIKPPEPRILMKAVAALRGADGPARDPEQTAALQARIAAAVHAGRVGGLSRRDLREGAKVFLHAPSPPGRDEAVGAPLFDEIETRRYRSGLLALIDAYLDGFQPGDDDVERLGAWIDDVVPNWAWRETDPWQERARKWRLFRAAEAPGRLAAAVLASEDGPAPVLSSAGLDTDFRSDGGFAEATFREACRIVARSSGGVAERLQAVLLDWGATPDETLVFPKSWPALVDALLAPWKSAEPSTAHKMRLLRDLDRFGGGDPRMKPARWQVVRDRAPESYAVLLRWLTSASVMQFLDIVDESLHEPDARRMWAYRRAFWTAYLVEGRIDAAWVAFGSTAASLARRAARASGEVSASGFGVHDISSKSGAQSALIVSIGDMLVVDWSHSGKYNVWDRGQGDRPALFQARYWDRLDNAPLRESHVGAANYTWQKRLAEIIEHRRYYSPKPEWRPRRV